MKAFSLAAATDYAAPERTVATCWHVERRDGEIFGFTDHDRAIPYGGVVYEAFAGFTASQLAANATLSVDNMEVTGLFDSAGITDADLEAGVWDGFAYEIFEINYVTRAWQNILTSGWVGQFRRDKGLFVAELRSLTAPLQKNVGATITPTCRYRFGDLNCKVDLAAITEFDVPVTSITSRRVFVASSMIADPRQFNWGVVRWTTGANAGYAMDVKSFDDATGEITLQLPMARIVAVADEFSFEPGCNKLLKTGPAEYLGDCKIIYDNVVNFGGEPEVPMPNRSVRLPGA